MTKTLEAKLRQRDDRTGRLVAAVVGEIVGAGSDGELVPTEAELALAEGRAYEMAEEMLARVKVVETLGAGAGKKTRGRPARGKAVTA